MSDTFITPAPAAPAAPPAPAAQPPSRAGVISDNDYGRLAPIDQERYARVRQGPEGGSEWRDRSTLPAEPAQPGAPASAPAVTADGRLQVGDMLLSADDVKGLMTEKAARDLRATQVPATAESYVAALPKNFKLPDGMTWQFNDADPALADIRALAKKSGWSQDDFSSVLAVHAAREIASENLMRTANRSISPINCVLACSASRRIFAISSALPSNERARRRRNGRARCCGIISAAPEDELNLAPVFQSC
jgi:hypothetical protein